MLIIGYECLQVGSHNVFELSEEVGVCVFVEESEQSVVSIRECVYVTYGSFLSLGTTSKISVVIWTGISGELILTRTNGTLRYQSQFRFQSLEASSTALGCCCSRLSSAMAMAMLLLLFPPCIASSFPFLAFLSLEYGLGTRNTLHTLRFNLLYCYKHATLDQ